MEGTELTTPAGGVTDVGGEGDAPDAPSYETIAREKGWKPKEEYIADIEARGDVTTGRYWVDAETYVKNQPLIDKVKIQNKKVKELEKTVDALARHYSTNVAQAKERAILDLKSERREAIELGEVNRVEEIDQKIHHVNQMKEPVSTQKGLAPEIEDFVEKQGAWFNKDSEMTQFAVAYNESYLKRNPGELSKSLDETMKAVKKAYPEKFENIRKSSPSAVEGSAPVSQNSTKYSTNRLTTEQKLVYKQLVQVHKQMDHDTYFKSLDEAGYLEK